MGAIDELKEKYKSGLFSQSELFVIGIALFCVGLVLGMIFSPKGDRLYGSKNTYKDSFDDNGHVANKITEE